VAHGESRAGKDSKTDGNDITVTQADRVLDFLWSVAPDGATNSQIAQRVGITSHQTVYMLTQQLLRQGLVRAEQDGRTWMFFAVEAAGSPALTGSPRGLLRARAALPTSTASFTFESLAREAMSQVFGVPLEPGSIPGVRKRFDLVSADLSIVGDAKYFTLVGGTRLPPAKFSVIAEHVWLLEKTLAPIQFLVFGNDRAVPALWLERHGHHATSVRFYFLTDDGTLERIHP
jgi:hypothetical protein